MKSLRRFAALAAVLLLSVQACSDQPPTTPDGVVKNMSLACPPGRHERAGCDPQPPVYQIPGSIDATGQTDVTRQLLDFIESVPDSSVIAFASGATYRIEGTLAIRDRHALTFDGHGARFVANQSSPPEYAQRDRHGELVKYPWRNRYHWSIVRGSDITLRNFVIRGANAEGGQGTAAYRRSHEAQHGVQLSAVEGALIEDIDISYVHGDFVYVGGINSGSDRILSRDIVVRGGQWSHNGRQGFAAVNVDGVVVENIRMTETRRASIDLEPNSRHDIIRNVTIRNSWFGPGRLNWFSAGGRAGTMENITLLGNRVIGNTLKIVMKTPEGSRRRNFRVIGNFSDTSAGSPRPLLEIARVDGVEIRNNEARLRADRDMTAVELVDCTDWVHEGNIWHGAARDLVVR